MVRSLCCSEEGQRASEKRQAFQGPCLMFGKGKVLAQGKCCVQGSARGQEV